MKKGRGDFNMFIYFEQVIEDDEVTGYSHAKKYVLKSFYSDAVSGKLWIY